jgi:hypothetical protein
MFIPDILTGFCASQHTIYPRVDLHDSNEQLIQKCIFDCLTFNTSLAFHTVAITKIVQATNPPKFPAPRKLYLTAVVISGIYTINIALKYSNLKPNQNTALLEGFRVLNHKYLPLALATLALYGVCRDKNRKPLVLTIGTMIITSKFLDEYFLKANTKYDNTPYFISLITWAAATYFNGLKN